MMKLEQQRIANERAEAQRLAQQQAQAQGQAQQGQQNQQQAQAQGQQGQAHQAQENERNQGQGEEVNDAEWNRLFEEENDRINREHEANIRAEQEDNQRRTAEEQRVVAEYVTKTEPQKLSEAITNIIVAPTAKTLVTEMQKEVIKEKSALIIKNFERAAELAQELKNNKAELAGAVKIANDDKAIANKSKEEQAILFTANIAQAAAPGKVKEAVKHLADQGTRSVSVASVTTEAVSSSIHNHLSGGNMSAVAAGDEDNGLITKEAVWVAGTFDSSHQGEDKGNASYDGKVAGGTIGGDLYIGEDNLVGLAYSRMNSDFKFKGSSNGDSLKANSDVVSLYGQQQFGDGFLLQEILSYSNSKITKKDVRIGGKIAQGKYTSKAYGAEANIGYQIAPVSGINLIPNIGVRYNNYKDSGYTEKGAGVNNMVVPSKSGNLVTGIAGIKVTAPQQLSNYTVIVPGLHASVENSLSSKQPKVKARFIWSDNYFENNASAKTPKTAYNVGASILTKHKNVELLATYNCNLRSKYQSHQGSLKLKVLF